MPLTPVAYPYVFGPVHSELFQTAPFVRWPDAHVYAREHGNRLGLGTYNHVPIAVPVEELGRLEKLPWRGEPFDLAIEIAISLLPPDRQFRPAQQLNGVFSMTPDNLPLLGPISGVDGLWVAEAVWITHAAGAARMLVDMMSNRDGEIDRLTTLSPVRFEGQPVAALEARSLRLYRDIYSTLEPKQIADTMLLLSAYRVFSFLTASAKVRAYSISAGNRMAPEFHMLDKRFPSKGK
jgi:hypothetical protein